jgi:hypothetical protein
MTTEEMSIAGYKTMQSSWTDQELADQIVALEFVIAYLEGRRDAQILVYPLKIDCEYFKKTQLSRDIDKNNKSVSTPKISQTPKDYKKEYEELVFQCSQFLKNCGYDRWKDGVSDISTTYNNGHTKHHLGTTTFDTLAEYIDKITKME